MIVPYEIAVKLKQLGFSKECRDFYMFSKENPEKQDSLVYGKDFKNHNILDHLNIIVGYASAPTVSEALQWTREKYKIVCAVEVDYYDGFYYTGKWTDRVINKFEYTNSFDEHNEAESALLDELLTYLEQKR